MIALPLQREARQAGNSSFVDTDLNVIEDQWQNLSQIKKLSKQELNQLLPKISPNASLISEQSVTDILPPCEVTAKPKPLVLESPPQQITITLANHIYFEVKSLPSALLARLRRLASFSNPVFFKTQALRFSTHGIPRFISCARIERGYLALPSGCLDDALGLLKENNIDPLVAIHTQERQNPSNFILRRCKLCPQLMTGLQTIITDGKSEKCSWTCPGAGRQFGRPSVQRGIRTICLVAISKNIKYTRICHEISST